MTIELNTSKLHVILGGYEFFHQKRDSLVYNLRLKVNFKPELIGVEGAKTPPKMLTHFHRAWEDSRKLFKVLRDQLDR